MRDFLDWLLDERQKSLYEFLVALAVTVIFLALCALALGPMGKLAFAAHLAKGFLALWLALKAVELVSGALMRLLKINMHDRWQVYVGAGLITGALAQAGWGAYVAAAARVGPMELAAGFVSCYAAHVVLSTVYTGSVYRLVNALVGAASFILFCQI